MVDDSEIEPYAGLAMQLTVARRPFRYCEQEQATDDLSQKDDGLEI